MCLFEYIRKIPCLEAMPLNAPIALTEEKQFWNWAIEWNLFFFLSVLLLLPNGSDTSKADIFDNFK